MGKRKLDAKTFAHQKRNRRRFLTFMRMCRYGVNNFSRNAWLTIAATAVMTITLLIVFVTLASRNVLLDTVDEISSRVDMSIYLETSTPDEAIQTVRSDLLKLENVNTVEYISPEEAREANARANSDDVAILEAINEATNQLPGTLRISLFDIDDTSQLDEFINTNQTYQEYEDSSQEPSFAGDRREAIKNITEFIGLAERVGLGATVLFVTISALIVFNTIRMAIFNRKEEIQMMKLIGADRNFIRGPFLVEAIVYGFIAAVVATALGLVLLHMVRDPLLAYDIAVQTTIDAVTKYVPLVLIAMILLGALIGVISSLLATRRYLKI